jgi:hypothetical protein
MATRTIRATPDFPARKFGLLVGSLPVISVAKASKALLNKMSIFEKFKLLQSIPGYARDIQ